MLFPTFRIPSRRAAGFRHVQKTEISKVIVILVGFKNVLGFAAHTPSKLEKLFPAQKHLQICIWFLKKKKNFYFSAGCPACSRNLIDVTNIKIFFFWI